MPRNGSSLYYIPPGTEGFPDTTIESEKYNNYIHDVETDLNLPRPIVSGGTGANDADEALANLHAEKASQEVDNFDSYAFMAGSFYSTVSTTAPPVAGHLFSGIAHITNASNMVLEAVDLSDAPHTQWIRVKTAGVWGPWMPRAIVTASDTPPTGSQANDNALWWESDTGILYVRYNDGNSTQWVVASPVPDVSSYLTQAEFAGSAVRYDTPQALSGPEQQQALQNIYAAPADAMAYSGMQINGGMEVSQERGTGAAANNAYVCDGWQFSYQGAMGASSAMATPFAIAPGFTSVLYYTVQTAQTSLIASDLLFFVQRIEGYRIARLGWGTASAQPITVSFWSSHARPGLYCVSIRNASPATRSCVATYTQSVGGTAQFNTVTIPGCTDGTWAADNTVGLQIAFAFAAGTTYHASAANVWSVGNFLAVAGQTNGVAATSDVGRITGVTVLPGIEAPSAGRSAFIMRPYGEELVTCMRYFESWSGTNSGFNVVAVGSAQSANVANVALSFKVRKRANPTLFSAGNFSFLYNGFGLSVTSGAVSILAPGLDSLLLQGAASGSSPFTVKEVIGFSTSDTNARLFFDARL